MSFQKEVLKVSKRKLLIICGHGDGDSGATSGGMTEEKLTRKLGNKLRVYGGDNVKLMNTKKNWYTEGFNKIYKNYNPKKWRIIELHMDSGGKSAKGGHVIINSTATAGIRVRALANVLKKHFAGRSKLIDKRDDLANPKRAAKGGFYYTLLECGFITNERDREYFVKHVDVIAKDILKACGFKPLSV